MIYESYPSLSDMRGSAHLVVDHHQNHPDSGETMLVNPHVHSETDEQDRQKQVVSPIGNAKNPEKDTYEGKVTEKTEAIDQMDMPIVRAIFEIVHKDCATVAKDDGRNEFIHIHRHGPSRKAGIGVAVHDALCGQPEDLSFPDCEENGNSGNGSCHQKSDSGERRQFGAEYIGCR
jgi:hypothetical protein